MGKARLVFEKQFLHLIGLSLLLYLLSIASQMEGFWEGGALRISTRIWLYMALANSIVHQLYVWLSWRLELHLNLLTRFLGKYAFKIYAFVFSLFLILRPVLIAMVAYANRHTIPVNRYVMMAVAATLLLPIAYLGYSIVRYFSFTRAFGIDHFDESYRSMPLVRQGIFRFTPNAMYLFGFTLLWAPAVFFSSVAALAFALFSHLYIWVHYFCTERPDMMRIYGRIK